MSGRRSDTATPASARSPRTPSPPVAKFFKALCRLREPAPRAPLFSVKAREPALYAPLRWRREPAPRVPLLSAKAREPALYAPLRRRREPALRAPLPSATALFRPLSLGTEASAQSTAPQSHAPRSSQTAAPARLSLQRGCPTPPPDHAVAVGLSCGKADTEAPRSRVQLDSAFPRKSGGRSTLFRAKEEPTGLATSSPFPSRSAGRKPPPVDNLVPPPEARF